MSDTPDAIAKITFGGISNQKDQYSEMEIPLSVERPCSCGCDQRGDPNLVGYVLIPGSNKGKNGDGISLPLQKLINIQLAQTEH